MINKKIYLGLFIVSFLGACTAPTAMLGPAYTFTSSGNIIQASLNYGSNQMITHYTGKTPIENLKEVSQIKKKQIMKASWSPSLDSMEPFHEKINIFRCKFCFIYRIKVWPLQPIARRHTKIW